MHRRQAVSTGFDRHHGARRRNRRPCIGTDCGHRVVHMDFTGSMGCYDSLWPRRSDSGEGEEKFSRPTIGLPAEAGCRPRPRRSRSLGTIPVDSMPLHTSATTATPEAAGTGIARGHAPHQPDSCLMHVVGSGTRPPRKTASLVPTLSPNFCSCKSRVAMTQSSARARAQAPAIEPGVLALPGARRNDSRPAWMPSISSTVRW